MDIGTYVNKVGIDSFDQQPLATATLETTVFDVVHQFSAKGISAVPIIDHEGVVINLYETVDVIVSYNYCYIETIKILITYNLRH